MRNTCFLPPTTPKTARRRNAMLQYRRRLTVVASQEAVSISGCDFSASPFLCVLQRDVHVAIEAGEETCGSVSSIELAQPLLRAQRCLPRFATLRASFGACAPYSLTSRTRCILNYTTESGLTMVVNTTPYPDFDALADDVLEKFRRRSGCRSLCLGFW